MDSKTTVTVLVLALLLFIGSRPHTTTSLSNVTESDIALLAQLIDSEAGGEPYEGMVAVGAVVVNRVLDERFPNTIRSVIFEPGQFYIDTNRRPNANSRRAAEAAVRGEDPTRGALFFYNPRTAVLDPWWNSRQMLTQIGNHVFLR